MALTFRRRDGFLPFSRPTIRQAEIDEVVDTLRSGWITTGPKTERFERELARLGGFREVLALSSATAGLHIGLLALGLGPGDEVITTSMTWAATVNMIEALGARPVFVDVDPRTLLMDAAAVADAVGDATAGILPVHFAGAPCDLDAILQVAHRRGLWVFEDAAHALGTRYKGRPVGGFDRLGVFSFHPIKNMTTGEGGALVASESDLARRLRALRFHGLEKSAWNRYAEGGSPQVEITSPGFKYNLTDLQAAMGLHQLASLEEFNERRRALASLYDACLGDVPEIDRPAVPAWDHVHARHLYVVSLSESAGMERDAFMAGLKDRGVGTGLHFRAVHTQPYYANRYPEWLGRLPHTERASERICSLPLFPAMTDDDVRYVAAAIRDVLAHPRS